MKNEIAIGVDIGGSHITSAAVKLDELRIVPGTRFSNKVDNKGSKESIFTDWSKAINQTIANIPVLEKANIGFAMPGPFHYRTGLAMFEGNDKYEKLYNVSIPIELPKYINTATSTEFRFLNDATSFGVGASAMGKAKNQSKIVAITLGTGFGSCFITDGVPQVYSEEVPKGGCLWDKPYKDRNGDDYFSTRWCLKRYWEVSSRRTQGVKEIAEMDDKYSKIVFEEFGTNMAEFMIPFLKEYSPQLIILGGNISKADKLFLPTLKNKIQESGLEIDFEISELMEDAAIIGSAKMFDPIFWNQIKEDLPNL